MTTKTHHVVYEIGDFNTFYNDRLQDGRRSLKVCYWPRERYMEAAEKLTQLGCKVEVRQKKNGKPYTMSNYRLHITE